MYAYFWLSLLFYEFLSRFRSIILSSCGLILLCKFEKDKNFLHNIYTFCTFLCKYFCKNVCTNFYTNFTHYRSLCVVQNHCVNLKSAKFLHRGKNFLHNFCTFCTYFAKKFAKIFAHIFTQFLHTILHKFCTVFTTAHFANFFAPQTT